MELLKDVLRWVNEGRSDFAPDDGTPESLKAFQSVAKRLVEAEKYGLLERVYPNKSSMRGDVFFLRVIVAGGVTFKGERFLKGEIEIDEGAMKSMTVNINNSHIGQVGNGNTLNVQMSIGQMVEAIQTSDASQEEKSGALNALKSFLAHPLTSALGGAALGGVLGL